MPRRYIPILALALIALHAPAARSEDYPARTVKIVVPFPAGGTADVLPRIVADWLSRKWRQSVIVENRTGAGGNIGAEFVAKSDPDGYTLLASPPPPLVINQNLYPHLDFDPAQFVPIVVMGRVPNALVVNPDKVVANSVKDFIAYVRANPGKVTDATQGNGTTSHLTSELFQMMAHVKLQNVPYRGSAPALNDLVAGSVDCMFDNLGVSMQLVKAGKL
jgi:tripartite-type tricarboxylate transporter receptor subunit TctC